MALSWKTSNGYSLTRSHMLFFVQISRLPRLVTLGVLSASLACASTTAFTLSPYNAFVFGSFTNSPDYGGGVAAGGTLTISNTTVAGSLLGEAFSQFPNGDTLVSGGNLTATSGTVGIGNIYGGGSANDFSLTMANGYSYTQSPAPIPSTSLPSSHPLKPCPPPWPRRPPLRAAYSMVTAPPPAPPMPTA